jgi:hypothetical protein
MHVFVGLAAILLFAACEQQSEQPRSRAATTPSPRAAKTAVKKDKDKNKLSKKTSSPNTRRKTNYRRSSHFRVVDAGGAE